MAGIKGMRQSRARTDADRDTVALARIEQLLDEVATGTRRINEQRLSALKIRYDKLRPALSSIEQIVHDARDQASEETLAGELVALFDAKPELWERVAALRGQGTASNDAAAVMAKTA